jgi:hypothetical protein
MVNGSEAERQIIKMQGVALGTGIIRRIVTFNHVQAL